MNTLDRSIKTAETTTEIHDLIANRWSPRAFDAAPISEETLNSLFEAARWAASSMNEQPWRFIYAFKGEPVFDEILETFNDANKIWAQNAPLLMLSLVKKTYSHNPSVNKSAHYDLGQAVANLSIQASHFGIGLHQIGGLSPRKAEEIFEIPEDYEVVTGLVLGYFGNPDTLPDQLRARELAKRSRKPVSEIAFHNTFID